MFQEAIEKVLQFTRPLHTISRTYGGLVLPGSSTFFFVNDQGVAITCKHVMDLIPAAENINRMYASYRDERNRIANDAKMKRNLQGLQLKYKYLPETTVQMKHNFLSSFDTIQEITCHAHPTLDLAILEFKGFNKTFYNGHATFVKDSSTIRQGKSLARIGFPFPEFNNFRHNPETDDIEWTDTGNPNSPSFPIDGIVTRFVATHPTGGITGIEMSTPGLRGQSGGPLFDTQGRIYGMQHATNHLHLGFDMKDFEIVNNGKKMKISNNPFLHVGICVHVDRIKDFLREKNIRFTESD
jgi:Trypsin-like peptidase domain